MFGILRSLVASVLGLAVLTPVCCCAAKVVLEELKPARHSCCAKQENATDAASHGSEKPCKDCGSSREIKKTTEEDKALVPSLADLVLKLQAPPFEQPVWLSFFQEPAKGLSRIEALERGSPPGDLVLLYHFIRC